MITGLFLSIKSKLIVAMATVSIGLFALVKYYANKAAKLEKKAEAAESKLRITKHNAAYKDRVLKEEKAVLKGLKEEVKKDDKKSKSDRIDSW